MSTAAAGPGVRASHGLGADLRKVGALIRADALSAASYRLRFVLTLATTAVSFVFMFFVSEAIQPVAAESIADEGERYFAFLMSGMAATMFIAVSMRGLLGAISGGITTGVLESLFTTPTRLPFLLGGLMAYKFARTTLSAVLFLLAVVVAGIPVAWDRLPLAAGILALVVLTYLGVGLVAAALHLIFRTSGPVVNGALTVSILGGGVYYSTTVIPELLQPLSQLIPLTYGLRALRRAVLHGASLDAVALDVLALAGFAAVFFTLGAVAFTASLRYARWAGTLTQY